MPIFKMSAAKRMRLLSGHILPPNALNFTCSHLDFKNFLGGESPDSGERRGGEGTGRKGLRVPTSIGRSKRERTGESNREAKEKEGEGRDIDRRILLQGLSLLGG